MRRCSLCREEKPPSEFCADKRRSDGLRSWCKACSNAKWRDYYHANRTDENERSNAWKRSNPTRNSAHSIAYKARSREVSQGDSTDLIEYRTILTGDPCSYCGERCEAIDHIDPLVKGGDNDWTNLTASCQRCNSSKRDKSLLSFL